MTLDSNTLNECAWSEWLEFRRKVKRKPVSEVAAKRQIKKLTSLPEVVQQMVIDHSIENDYTGLFPEKFAKMAEPVRQSTDNFIERHTDSSWADGL